MATAVPVPPSVKAVTASGQAVSGIPVTFSVAAGGGTISGASAVTNLSGIATLGGWTLGTVAGTQEVTASAPGLAPVSFRATAVAGTPASLQKHEGDAQSGRAGRTVTTAPAVRVRDMHANAVANATVTFAVAAGGGSITGGSATTNAEGVARVGSWTLGGEGANGLTAAVTGLATVTFTATATDPWNYIISDESPTCPIGGPIHRLRSGQLTTLAQGGQLRKPRGMIRDGQGNLIVADGHAGLFRVSLATGTATRIAVAPPYSPRDVAIDAIGNYIAVESPGPTGAVAAVYRITPAGQVTIVAQGSPLTGPHGLVLDAQGNYIVSDVREGLFRITPQGQITTVARAAPMSTFVSGTDVALDASGNYIVGDGFGGAVLRVTPAGAVTTVRRGSPFNTINPSTMDGGPRGVVVDDIGNYIVVDHRARAVFRVTPAGEVSQIFQGGALCAPADVMLEPKSP